MVNEMKCLELIQEAYAAPDNVFFKAKDGILAFRGSENLNDWIANLSVTYADHPVIGRVHLGFWVRWKAIQRIVEAEVERRRPAVVVGHSLGGAMAVLAALTMDWNPRVVTFGAPRIGDERFAQMVDYRLQKYERIENWGDPVPWVPTYWRGWRHAGRARMIGSIWRWPSAKHHGVDAYRQEMSGRGD